MQRRFFSAGHWRGLGALAAAWLACGTHSVAQQPLPGLLAAQPGQTGANSSGTGGKSKAKNGHKHAAEDEGQHPEVSIPVGPLGFAPPAPFYLGDRLAQVSLDFLDEDKLLFTFRVPGLIAREHTGGNENSDGVTEEERNIRAVVLSLPSGKVEAEALWRLHDFGPYLWMLQDHRFLLRDRNQVQVGDATLHLEPFLRFPGPVRYIEVDPQEKFLVTQSVETPKPDTGATEGSATIASNTRPDGGQGSVLPSGNGDAAPKPEPDNLLRVLRLRDRQVLLMTHIENGLVHLPVDGDGYYDAVRDRGFNWQIMYRSFTGQESPMLMVDSTCDPSLDVLAPGVVLASACAEFGGRRLTVLTRGKQQLWETSIAPTRVWPTLVRDAAGTRMARATLDINHPITAREPLDPTDIHGQTVQVFDLATGKVVLTGPASPVLDGGGGFALSPSGRLFAVLNAGAIQVYGLPAPPPLPIDDGAKH